MDGLDSATASAKAASEPTKRAAARENPVARGNESMSVEHILKVWESYHGLLGYPQRASFLEHPAVQAFSQMDGDLVSEALSREPKLRAAMAYVRSRLKERRRLRADENNRKAEENNRKAEVRRKMRNDGRVDPNSVARGPVARAWVAHSLDELQKSGTSKAVSKTRVARDGKCEAQAIDTDPGF